MFAFVPIAADDNKLNDCFINLVGVIVVGCIVYLGEIYC